MRIWELNEFLDDPPVSDALIAEAVAGAVLKHLPRYPMTEGNLEGFTTPVRRELEAIA